MKIHVLCLCGLSMFGQDSRLERMRNLGKAFYENPATQKEAADTLKQALDLAPGSARERLNYGLGLLRAGRTAEAMAELSAVQKTLPALPHTWFTLGIEFKKQGETAKALVQMSEAKRLDPQEPIVRYNMGVLLKQEGRTSESIAEFEAASKLDQNLAAAHFQLFNAYRQAARAADAQRELAIFQGLKKQTEGAAVPEDIDWSQYSEIYDPKPAPPPRDTTPLKWLDRKLPTAWKGAIAFGDRPLFWDERGLSLNGATIFAVAGIKNVAAGDFDNDGLVDLCAVTATEALLLRNGGAAGWKRVALNAKAAYAKCVWLDYDHDYDLDLVLLGDAQTLLRNQGKAGFADRTADFPFVKGKVQDAVAFRVVPDTRGFDLAVTYADRKSVLYRDLLLGKYTAEDFTALPAGASHLGAADLDNSGAFELIFTAGSQAMRTKNLKETLVVPGVTGQAIAADLRNDGHFELVNAVAALDRNADGRADLLVHTDAGWIERINRTPAANRAVTITLQGVKNVRTAPASEVEVKVAGLYQKRLYQGFPLRFGVGKATQVDVVRVTWPNGLIQNEMKQPVRVASLIYKEAQRLSGSCPIVWTWNGKAFEYITDVLGVAPLGASAGDATFFEADHDEYIAIAAGQLKPDGDGMLSVRLTEELSEAAYFDQVRLLAIDHPAGTEIFSNEKWKGPPFPDFRLYEVKERLHARRATDQHGNDVTALLRARDRTYPNSYRRNTAGVAERHSITLDFGGAAKDNDAILVLHGWVDWADGSTFLAAAQEGTALTAPSLQVRDAQGTWRTVIDDMGMPSGKPKTIAVNLAGKFLGASREVRIVTNLCVYWDEIFLSEGTGPAQHLLTALSPKDAALRFRGFSPSKIHPARKQPEEFSYPDPQSTSLWNPTPGNYTRYGDVTALAKALDDRLVVMGSGDELSLRFEASALPPLRAGWRRDYLLHVDGWAKDRDANTAYSQNVAPLPFHRMSGYPYKLNDERSPGEEAQRQWNTRPALRLIRPLQ